MKLRRLENIQFAKLETGRLFRRLHGRLLVGRDGRVYGTTRGSVNKRRSYAGNRQITSRKVQVLSDEALKTPEDYADITSDAPLEPRSESHAAAPKLSSLSFGLRSSFSAGNTPLAYAPSPPPPPTEPFSLRENFATLPTTSIRSCASLV